MISIYSNNYERKFIVLYTIYTHYVKGYRKQDLKRAVALFSLYEFV